MRATPSGPPAPYPATTTNRLSAQTAGRRPRRQLDVGHRGAARRRRAAGSVGHDVVSRMGSGRASFHEASSATHHGRRESSKRPTMWSE